MRAEVVKEMVALVKYHGEIVTSIDDPQYGEPARKSLAHELVAALLRNGYITFTKGEADEMQRTRKMRAMLGVVSAAKVASMEERIAERQMEVASKLVSAAADEIRVWGRYYTGDEGNISKGQAVDAVVRAFKGLKP